MQYPVIGIDLGTCFSCVYGFRNGMFTLVPGDCGNTTPSVIQYGPKGPVFGQMAKKSIRSNPTNTIYDVKRFLGLPYEQCQSIIEHEHYGFKCIPYNRSLVYEIQYNNQSCFTTPEHVDADFLKYLVKRAEEHLEYKVEGAVITIPAFFQYSQTDATLRAAKEAGLNIYCIVYEPNAAAIAINPIPGVDERHFLVFDLGGGTFDVALIQAKLHDYRIIGHGGHPFLGGRDFDQVVVNLIEEALKPYCDISTWRPSKMARLRTYAEEVKIELSQTKAVELDLSDFDVDLDAPVYITRKQFENGIKGYVDLAIQICDATLQSTGISLGRNDCILLVGGSSKIPLVREELRKKYGDIIETNNNPDEDVAKGACMVALHKYCTMHVPPLPNPRAPTVLHTSVMRAVGVAFGNEPIQTVLHVGDECNKESEPLRHSFILNTKISIYCKDAPNSGTKNTEWRFVESFPVHGFMGKAYITLMLNEMGRLRYTIGIEGQAKKEVNTLEIAKENSEAITVFNKRLYTVREGAKLLEKDIQYVNLSNTAVKQQLITNLQKAIAFLRDEKALRVSSESIKQYVDQNHEMVLKYAPRPLLGVLLVIRVICFCMQFRKGWDSECGGDLRLWG